MAQTTNSGSRFIQLRQYIKRFFLIFSCLVLAGCVANSPLPPQNIGSLLTPETPGETIKTDTQQANLAPPQLAPSEQATNARELSPAVKSSLVPESKPEAVEGATSLVTQQPTPPPGSTKEVTTTTSAPPAPAQVETKPVTALKPVAPVAPAAPTTKPKAAPEQSPKQSKSLFSLLTRNNEAARSKTKLALKKKRTRPRVKAVLRKGKTGLPGVRLKNLFGVDSNETEEFDEPIQVASVTNLARKGKHGLLVQRPSVKVGCFPPKLVRILKQVGRRFGRSTVVTSGYRNSAYNRRVGGARKSTHVRCIAADIQVKGVSKWKMAKYLRTIPGRGGVGTYCHTNSVHIDIGTKRAWHGCKRRRGSRRAKR